MSQLDPADHLARHLRPTGEVLLPPAPLRAHPAERRTQLPIVHRGSLAAMTYRRLIRGSTGRSSVGPPTLIPPLIRRYHGQTSRLPRRATHLDIERPFVIMIDKEARVTKHDAERKLKIIDFIAATLRARGYPPSIREIARAVGLASTSAVHHHLQILEREGYLERGADQSRAIRLTPTAAIKLGLTNELVPQATAADARVLPIIGEIAAGGPIEAYQDASETMAVPDLLAPSGDAYVLRVRGDSMIEAHIADGDFVLIRPQTTARNGDIVVAQVEENAVTLKRFFKEKDQIRLQPANQAYPPQFYDDVRIQGKLIGVIRRLD
jgi:repressor LexA